MNCVELKAKSCWTPTAEGPRVDWSPRLMLSVRARPLLPVSMFRGAAEMGTMIVLSARLAMVESDVGFMLIDGLSMYLRYSWIEMRVIDAESKQRTLQNEGMLRSEMKEGGKRLTAQQYG